jgi:hypothetical protein
MGDMSIKRVFLALLWLFFAFAVFATVDLLIVRYLAGG